MLAAALTAADLVTTLKGTGPFTVFAPTDAAFAKLPNATVVDLLKPENKAKLAQILKYHVLNGKIQASDIKGMTLPMQKDTLAGVKAIVDGDATTVLVNKATVTIADVAAKNGVIHAIDTVLMPPSDIVSIAAGNPSFSKLVAALNATGLGSTLNGTGPFTVFAPTDAAFDKLPAGTVDDLLKPANKDKLANILKFHVSDQLLTAASIGRMKLPGTVTMKAGGSNDVSKDASGLMINSARINSDSVFASNGMIHPIDMVLMPKASSAFSSYAHQGLLTIILSIVVFSSQLFV